MIKKNVITFGVTLLCGIMFISSCKKDDNNDIDNLKMATVNLSVVMPDLGQKNNKNFKLLAGNVNEGSMTSAIKNVMVVPYLLQNGNDEMSMGAIKFNDESSFTSSYKKDNVDCPVGNVNFIFYGNTNANNWSGDNSIVKSKHYSDVAFNLEMTSEILPGTTGSANVDSYYKKPASMFYYGASDVTVVTDNSGSPQGVALTANYAIANLATLIRNSNPTNNGHLTFKGLLIGNQPKIVDYKFDPTSDYSTSRKVAVYDNVINRVGIVNEDAFPTELETGNHAGHPLPSNVDIYTLLFSTPSYKIVPVSLIVSSDKDITLTNGTVVSAGTEIYLPAVQLDHTKASIVAGVDPTKVFQKDVMTIARFTINSLINGTVTPPSVESASVNLDVTVDVQWQAGATYDVEID